MASTVWPRATKRNRNAPPPRSEDRRHRARRSTGRCGWDRTLGSLQPEPKKDESGRVLYAVYRSDQPLMACLLVAPGLAEVFKKLLAEEVWLVAPDRNSLFVFPGRNDAVEEFADDLKERF